MAPQACGVFVVPALLDALLPNAIFSPTAAFVFWCLYFLCSLKFLGPVELFKPAWGREDKAQLWTGEPAGHGAAAASRGRWVKPI